MDFDIKGFIIALLLGVLSGLGFANVFNIDFSSAIATTGTFLAGVGAIGTVYIAYRALHSWKEKVAYDTLKVSVRSALVLLDRIYIDGTSIRSQSLKLYEPKSEITTEEYVQGVMNAIEAISRYNFYILDMELYSKKLSVQPNGIETLIKDRKSNTIRAILGKISDLALKDNESGRIDKDDLDTIAKEFFKTVNTQKELIYLFYKGLINDF